MHIASTYSSPGIKHKVPLMHRKPRLLPSVSHMSEAKQRDVQKLLSFVELTPEEEDYYGQIVTRVSKTAKDKASHPREQ